MFEALKGMVCFVTVAVSFIYGSRIAWVCGKKCQFNASPDIRKHNLFESIPAATAIYVFGFLILFSLLFDGFVTITVFSLTSAILLSNMVVSMAMPELKRKPRPSAHSEPRARTSRIENDSPDLAGGRQASPPQATRHSTP